MTAPTLSNKPYKLENLSGSALPAVLEDFGGKFLQDIRPNSPSLPFFLICSHRGARSRLEHGLKQYFQTRNQTVRVESFNNLKSLPSRKGYRLFVDAFIDYSGRLT